MIEIGEDFRVHVSDVTRAGYCHKAARQWFAERGLPWMDFISQKGVSAALLASYDDGIANRVIEAARKRQRK